MLWRYELGKKRLEDNFALKVVGTPHALRGSKYLYENPQARAEDLPVLSNVDSPHAYGGFVNRGHGGAG